jgi:hypothetical protein
MTNDTTNPEPQLTPEQQALIDRINKDFHIDVDRARDEFNRKIFEMQTEHNRKIQYLQRRMLNGESVPELKAQS